MGLAAVAVAAELGSLVGRELLGKVMQAALGSLVVRTIAAAAVEQVPLVLLEHLAELEVLVHRHLLPVLL